MAVLVAAFVLVRYATTPTAAPPAPASNQGTMSILTSLPPSELDQVGLGTATATVVRVSEPPLAGPAGHPALLYVGAQYCPYCAAERWPLIVALSRFGTFSGVGNAASSASDVYPSTPTFTFAGATFASTSLDLVAVEQDAGGTVTAAENTLVQRYGHGGIPFIDFGNRAVLPGATYSPELLQGMTQLAVARSLQDPTTPQARAILGSANLLTAAICLETGQQPAAVCSSAGVRAAAARIG